MASAGAGETFDIAEFIDSRPLGRREFTMLAVVTTMLFIDGFDTYFFGKILPAVAAGLGAEPVDMSQVVLWTAIGMMVGAFLMPPLGDRIGRKPVLALCAGGFGVLTIAAVWSQSVWQMALLRGLAGIFFSAMLPIGMALLSEMIPRRHRASFMAIALVGYSGGNAASGAIAAWLLDLYGWQIGFWIGGVLGLASLPLLWLIPESIAFRLTRDANDPNILATVRALDPAAPVSETTRFVNSAAPPPEKRVGPFGLLAGPYRVQTLILWAACFLSLGNIAILANWLPTFFLELGGIPIQQFAISAMIAFAGGAAGTLMMGWLMDRVNPYWLVAAFFMLDALTLFGMGQLPFGTAAFLGAMIAWNYSQVGGQTGINTLATLNYPPELRSSGVGWAGGWGRIAGIALPAPLGVQVLEMRMPLDTVMALIAAPCVVIALLIAWLGVANRGVMGVPAGKPAVA